ncbi:Sjogren's syndrome/scleroderma autoantigen 1 family protein [Methanolobus sp. ZRKC3]|uniref:Sjogren's syndrome/scleroderma autoantigen 1 family protein n=1 Tax=Methanolobus sp. ZRKC3 TaxID=3125786 RepID=UPI00324F4A1E
MAKIEDDKVQKISNMLEIGATMLAQHCTICGAPMFRYQGRVLCPVCEGVSDPRDNYQQAAQPVSRAAPERSVTNKTVSSGAQTSPEDMKVEGAADDFLSKMDAVRSVPLGEDVSPLSTELESLLMAKMVSIARSMQDERDARIITDYMGLIERGISIVGMLRKPM